MTGAPLPEGRMRSSWSKTPRCAREGDDQRPCEDGLHQEEGREPLHRTGGTPNRRLLSPACIALAGTMGHGTVRVIQRPRIAILSTGDELVQPGLRLEPGQIYESNSHALASLVEAMGCEAVRHESTNDSLDELRATLDTLAGCDAILTSGGVSMGAWDLVRRIMEEEGEISF